MDRYYNKVIDVLKTNATCACYVNILNSLGISARRGRSPPEAGRPRGVHERLRPVTEKANARPPPGPLLSLAHAPVAGQKDPYAKSSAGRPATRGRRNRASSGLAAAPRRSRSIAISRFAVPCFVAFLMDALSSGVEAKEQLQLQNNEYYNDQRKHRIGRGDVDSEDMERSEFTASTPGGVTVPPSLS
ncbi:hypothetical protein EVAR_51455_1 [Eumeta japonica]|uniref:Uncharacterized protein n=1 Tax=Eumeta variegata TaxID=151549 RepID=A0A4C1XW27_EUMVA|nr:hypothetical protein EVAR_51455_1 [Eumeta japonica]